MSSVKTNHWQKLQDGRVQCDVCPRQCKMNEGQRGLCFVRGNESGQVVLYTYGRSSGFCIDPIEKKPLNHFLPGTPVLSFGTAGCNLTCAFCQNHDISKARQMDALMSAASPQKIATVAQENGCQSVAYTYNDPVIFLEYAVDTALACHDMGLKNVAVSAGYISPGAREDFFAPMDAANIDLKAFTEGFYHKLTAAHLQPVLDTLVYLVHETNVWVEITTLLIPGKNDSPDEIKALAAWVAENLNPNVPVHFSAFHPDYKMTDLPRTPLQTLQTARNIAKAEGLNHVYTGNVHDPEGDTTTCTTCGQILIGRDWFNLTEWNLTDNGHCTKCDTPLTGVFNGPPGTWGAKRQPVRMG